MDNHPRKDASAKDDASAESHEEYSKWIAGIFRDLTKSLNYYVTEHWLLSLLAACAFGLIVFAVQSQFSIKPLWWGFVGLITFGILLCMAGVDVYRFRSRSAPAPSAQPAKISAELESTFKQLRRSFELLALQSNGLFHILEERQHAINIPDPPPELPPGLSMTPSDRRKFVFSFDCPPGDALGIRTLGEDESGKISADANDRIYYRDASGHTWAVLEPAIVRNGYFYGDQSVMQQFGDLANGAAIAFLGIPDDVVARLPASIRALCREYPNTVRRFRFGEFDFEPIPIGCMARGWDAGVLPFEHGLVIDFPVPDMSGGNPSSRWMLLLHRLGWEATAGMPLHASKWFWLGQSSFLVRGLKDLPNDPAWKRIPRTRWFSALSPNSTDSATDVCRASTWAIDRLMELMS